MTAGGDGTFLLAASRIRQRNKPVIGINTDPQGSEGYMCLMRKLPKEHFRSALQRLLSGDFSWLYRQRIRITLSGDAQHGVGDSVDLHDRQLNQEPSTTRWSDSHPTPNSSVHRTPQQRSPRSSDAESSLHAAKKSKKRPRSPFERVTVQLPVLALNEVFIGESLSSRVSYYEIQIDDGKMVKQKSSGIAMCTGTGSTSWYFNINKLTEQCVSELLRIVSDRCEVSLPVDDKKVVSDICTTFNQQLIFSPDLRRMAFTVRDPIFNATFPPITPRGFAEKIVVKSRGYDAHLVVDGGVSYRFNDGAEASLEVHEEDALQTVIFSMDVVTGMQVDSIELPKKQSPNRTTLVLVLQCATITVNPVAHRKKTSKSEDRLALGETACDVRVPLNVLDVQNKWSKALYQLWQERAEEVSRVVRAVPIWRSAEGFRPPNEGVPRRKG
ncbi:hypothetical protein ANCDUO_13358 [Ancylostoma duodenale]|uniref:NAD(+) kinase n=1 Tax=Ancylostoma duodenale TaxID=51022 RepID=A0A0C2D349_9BILA|nr:hypothetical protein ANCDUO_13358 [Ancylostoma duodenale]